jgi:hypothetical protein
MPSTIQSGSDLGVQLTTPLRQHVTLSLHREQVLHMIFDFDPAFSATQNIEKFYKHIESLDSELAALLKANLPTMLPVSENPTHKTNARQHFNETVLKTLDRPKAGPTK